jgi:hypothetical protein
MILVLTTLTHLLIIPFSPSPYYSAIITTSTVVSALWHYSGSSAISYLGVIDHLLAAIWFMADMGYPIDDKVYVEVILLNAAVATMSPIFYSIDYTIGYSVWNIVSALKCIYVANLLKE